MDGVHRPNSPRVVGSVVFRRFLAWEGAARLPDFLRSQVEGLF